MALYTKADHTKARINIKLDMDRGGRTQKLELPFNILALGDFSPGRQEPELKYRSKINVTKRNINDVIADLSPQLAFDLESPKGSQFPQNQLMLKFDSLVSFTPDSIVQQVPHLKKLVAMRNLLKELRSKIIDDTKLMRKISAFIQSDEIVHTLHAALSKAISD